MGMHIHQPWQQQIVGKIQGFRRCTVHLRAAATMRSPTTATAPTH